VVVSTTTGSTSNIVVLDPLQISIPVMSGRLRSSKISSACPWCSRPLPSEPKDSHRGLVPLVNGTISLLTPDRLMLRSSAGRVPRPSSIMMMVTWLAHESLFRLVADQVAGIVIVKVLP